MITNIFSDLFILIMEPDKSVESFIKFGFFSDVNPYPFMFREKYKVSNIQGKIFKFDTSVQTVNKIINNYSLLELNDEYIVGLFRFFSDDDAILCIKQK